MQFATSLSTFCNLFSFFALGILVSKLKAIYCLVLDFRKSSTHPLVSFKKVCTLDLGNRFSDTVKLVGVCLTSFTRIGNVSLSGIFSSWS